MGYLFICLQSAFSFLNVYFPMAKHHWQTTQSDGRDGSRTGIDDSYNLWVSPADIHYHLKWVRNVIGGIKKPLSHPQHMRESQGSEMSDDEMMTSILEDFERTKDREQQDEEQLLDSILAEHRDEGSVEEMDGEDEEDEDDEVTIVGHYMEDIPQWVEQWCEDLHDKLNTFMSRSAESQQRRKILSVSQQELARSTLKVVRSIHVKGDYPTLPSVHLSVQKYTNTTTAGRPSAVSSLSGPIQLEFKGFLSTLKRKSGMSHSMIQQDSDSMAALLETLPLVAEFEIGMRYLPGYVHVFILVPQRVTCDWRHFFSHWCVIFVDDSRCPSKGVRRLADPM